MCAWVLWLLSSLKSVRRLPGQLSVELGPLLTTVTKKCKTVYTRKIRPLLELQAARSDEVSCFLSPALPQLRNEHLPRPWLVLEECRGGWLQGSISCHPALVDCCSQLNVLLSLWRQSTHVQSRARDVVRGKGSSQSPDHQSQAHWKLRFLSDKVQLRSVMKIWQKMSGNKVCFFQNDCCRAGERRSHMACIMMTL